MKKYIAEMLGTFILVFVGCGTIVFSAGTVGPVGIALAFGLGLTAAIYMVGHVSGAHLNPAVSLGFFASGRMSFKDLVEYILFQLIGASLASYVILLVVKGRGVPFDLLAEGLGQNTWGADTMFGFQMCSAIIFELVATFIFVRVILQVTKGECCVAGLIIGLTLAVLLLLGMQITGGSLNPARSFGPAIFVGGRALGHLWLFLVVPSIGGALAGLSSRFCCCCDTCEVAPKAATKKPAKKK